MMSEEATVETTGKLTLAEANKLAGDNIKLAHAFARKSTAWAGLDFDELDSICMEALIRASRGFIPSRGFQFSTYAFKVMNFAITRHVKAMGFDIRVINKKAKQIPQNKDGQVYQIEDYQSFDPAFVLGEEEDKAKLLAAMKKLTEREQVVIHRRFFDGVTLAEVGREIGFTREYVRQIESKAIKRLKRLVRTKPNVRKRIVGGSKSVMLKCPNCEISFPKRLANVRQNQRRGYKDFCSPACFAEYKRGKGGGITWVRKTCSWCDKSFQKRKSQIKAHEKKGQRDHYCSTQCSMAAMKDKKGWRPWTKEEEEVVRKHYKTHTHKKIGLMLDRSKQCIDSKCYSLGLTKVRKWTEEEDDAVRCGYREKIPPKVIAAKLHVPDYMVRNRAKVLGVVYSRVKGEERNKIVEMLRAGDSDRRVGEVFQRAPHTIARVRRSEGIKSARVYASPVSKSRRESTMLKRFGVTSSGHLRAEKEKRACIALGWPQAKSLTEARVLDCLLTGPKTKNEIGIYLGTLKPFRDGYYRIGQVNALVNRGLVECQEKRAGCRHKVFALAPGVSKVVGSEAA